MINMMKTLCPQKLRHRNYVLRSSKIRLQKIISVYRIYPFLDDFLFLDNFFIIGLQKKQKKRRAKGAPKIFPSKFPPKIKKQLLLLLQYCNCFST